MDGWVGGWVGHVDRVMSCHVMSCTWLGGGGVAATCPSMEKSQ